MAPESKGQWSQMDPGAVSGKQFLRLGARIKGPGLACLLEWTSDTRAMETKPSPLWGKG